MSTNQAIAPETLDPETDPALALSAGQLDALAVMRGTGMMVVETIGKLVQGKASEPEKAAFHGVDLSLAFHRVSRAVRQIIAMEQEIAGLRETRRKAIIGARKRVAQKIMGRVIKEAAYKEGVDSLSVEARILEACRDYDDYDDYDRGTQAEIVMRLCKALRIENPDLSIWIDEAADRDVDDPPAGTAGAWRDIPDASSPIWRQAARSPPS